MTEISTINKTLLPKSIKLLFVYERILLIFYFNKIKISFVINVVQKNFLHS